MGDNVIDDAQVVFEVANYGTRGKIILNSVTLTIERDTNGYSGIGNEGEVAVGYGARSASLSHEQMLNEEAGEMLRDLYENDRSPKGVSILAGDALTAEAAKFDWNNLELNIEDDGDTTVSIDGKIRGLEMD